MDWKGWTSVGGAHKKTVDLKKNILFAQKCVGGIKQGAHIALDLMEAMVNQCDHVKGASRRISMKMNQLRAKIINIKVSTFGCREKSQIPADGQHSKRP